MNTFQIIEKIESDKKVYFLKKKVFGFNLYQWSFVDFTQSLLTFPLLAFINIMSYNYFNTPLIILTHIVSVVIAYHIGKKRYDTLHEAEAEIKNYVKEKTKTAKTLPTKSSNVLNYHIDIEKGIFEKEFQSNNRK